MARMTIDFPNATPEFLAAAHKLVGELLLASLASLAGKQPLDVERNRALASELLDGQFFEGMTTDVEHEHEPQADAASPFKLVRCPTCNEPPEGTCDVVPGVARLLADEEAGTMDYEGDTRMGWDGQTVQYNAKGEAEFWCRNCDTSFHAKLEAASEG